ncbi:hypothetical protein MMCCUG48898_4452 [Mycobacteroides abscessus subsp. massiliense CCUG 48898 = JCM 15300]|nr:hypothetical protein MMCCUG48898_4452 [Mycobacteroides abscessus subsp. massiliense CCUG 48898 = JCM 15300]
MVDIGRSCCEHIQLFVTSAWQIATTRDVPHEIAAQVT